MRKISVFVVTTLLILCVGLFSLNAKAQGLSEEPSSSGLITANLIEDYSFESITEDNLGKWVVDVNSDAAGTKGTFTIVNDAYSGSKAVQLKGAGNDSGYPEISQKITVLPNSTYYVTLRVKNNNTSMSSANLFFGFASSEREGETIYSEQHRWADNSVDLDKIYQNDDQSYAHNKGFSLYSARLTTGNEANVRLYIRIQKMNVTIDDVTVTYAAPIVPMGSENLLENPGFEESINARPLTSWMTIGETSEGFSAGIDDVRTTSAYTPGSNMQDKQIEGFNALYLVAQSGAEGQMTIGQEVAVEANKNYAFYANLSKWGEIKATAGLQQVEIGILAADMETVLTRKRIDGADISLSRYMLASVVTNVGDNTKVYPYIIAKTKGFGTYGAGLYVDECYFFETKLNVPTNKTNLLSNGDLNRNSDGWYEVGGSSQLGWENGSSSGKHFAGNGNEWLSQWDPYDGMVQSATLKKDSLYYVTAYMRTYFDTQWGTLPTDYDGLYSPVSILVFEGDDENASEVLAGNDVESLTLVARQNVRLERDDAYMPITLIFKAPKDGVYSFFVGFEGGCHNSTWQGGVQIGGISVFETSMDELAKVEETVDYDNLLVNTSDDITLSEEALNIAKVMTVAEFNELVYAQAGFTLKVLDEANAEVTSGNMKTGYKVVIIKDGETVKSYSVTAKEETTPVTPPTTQNGGEKEQPKKGCKSVVAASIISFIMIGLVPGFVVLKRKSNKE